MIGSSGRRYVNARPLYESNSQASGLSLACLQKSYTAYLLPIGSMKLEAFQSSDIETFRTALAT